MYKCLDTEKRNKKLWTKSGTVDKNSGTSTARKLCAGFKYMSLECPTNNDYDVWCTNNIDNIPELDDSACNGITSNTSLNNVINAKCSGINGGAIYAI